MKKQQFSKMVDVSAKQATVREAVARGIVQVPAAVPIAALTVDDMGNAVSQGIPIRDIRPLQKTGGQSD